MLRLEMITSLGDTEQPYEVHRTLDDTERFGSLRHSCRPVPMRIGFVHFVGLLALVDTPVGAEDLRGVLELLG